MNPADGLLLGTEPLRSIATRVRIESYYANNANSENYHPLKGVWLDGTKGPTREHPAEQDGKFEGWDTYLLTDGSILDLSYNGTWTVWDGMPSAWKAKAHVVAPENAARYLVDEGSDHNAIDAIQAALDAWLAGKAVKRTEQAQARAAKIRKKIAAIVELTQ